MNNGLKSFMLLDSLVGISILSLVVTLVFMSTSEFRKLENKAYRQLLEAQTLLTKCEQKVQTLSADKIREEGIKLTIYDGEKVQIHVLEK